MDKSQPRKYQAYGTVEGVLSLEGSSPTLSIGKSVFSVFQHIPKKVRNTYQPKKIERFDVFAMSLYGKPSFRILRMSKRSADGLKLKGCWEKRRGNTYLVVYRNNLDSPTDNLKRLLIPLLWEDAPSANGKFWELEVQIQGDQLKVTQAEGPFPAPPKATRYKLRPKTTTQKAMVTPIPLTVEEIQDMATPSKVQLTCKLNQVPAHRQLPDKNIEFFLSDDGNRIFTVRMKPKQFKKLLDHGYENWVAAITGELGAATVTGFELVHPALQIFEKKASSKAAEHEKAPSQDPSKSAAIPKSLPKETVKPTVGQRKSLLDGVTLR